MIADSVVRTYIPEMIASIDRGWPVLIQSEECGILYAHSDSGRKLIGEHYNVKGEYALDRMPWSVTIFRSLKNRLSRHDAAVRSFRIAVEMARTWKFESYRSGFAAYEQWISELKDEPRYAKTDLTFNNWWLYDCLRESRHAAVVYLHSIEKDFQGASLDSLKNATALYEQVSALIDSGYKQLPAMGRGRWTKANRSAQAVIICKCLDLEKRAIAEFEEILKLENAGIGEPWLLKSLEVKPAGILVPRNTKQNLQTILHVVNHADKAVHVTLTPDSVGLLMPSVGKMSFDLPAKGLDDVPVSITNAGPGSWPEVTFASVNWTAKYQGTSEKYCCSRGTDSIRIISQYPCPITKNPVKVDGNITEWDNLPFAVKIPGQVLEKKETYTGPDDCRFSFGVAYDEKYIYFAARVIDDARWAVKQGLAWDQDGIEVRIDGRPDSLRLEGKGEEWTDILPICLTPAIEKGKEGIWNIQMLPRGVVYKCVRSDSGFTTEVGVPVSYLNKQQGAWKNFGLNVAVDDWDDSTGRAQIWWKPDWRSKSSYPGACSFEKQ